MDSKKNLSPDKRGGSPSRPSERRRRDRAHDTVLNGVPELTIRDLERAATTMRNEGDTLGAINALEDLRLHFEAWMAADEVPFGITTRYHRALRDLAFCRWRCGEYGESSEPEAALVRLFDQDDTESSDDRLDAAEAYLFLAESLFESDKEEAKKAYLTAIARFVTSARDRARAAERLANVEETVTSSELRGDDPVYSPSDVSDDLALASEESAELARILEAQVLTGLGRLKEREHSERYKEVGVESLLVEARDFFRRAWTLNPKRMPELLPSVLAFLAISFDEMTRKEAAAEWCALAEQHVSEEDQRHYAAIWLEHASNLEDNATFQTAFDRYLSLCGVQSIDELTPQTVFTLFEKHCTPLPNRLVVALERRLIDCEGVRFGTSLHRLLLLVHAELSQLRWALGPIPAPRLSYAAEAAGITEHLEYLFAQEVLPGERVEATVYARGVVNRMKSIEEEEASQDGLPQYAVRLARWVGVRKLGLYAEIQESFWARDGYSLNTALDLLEMLPADDEDALAARQQMDWFTGLDVEYGEDDVDFEEAMARGAAIVANA